MLALTLLPFLALPAAAAPFAIVVNHTAVDSGNVQGFALPLSHSESSARRELAKRAGGAQDGTWLLHEQAFVDGRYNEGRGNFGSLLAAHQRRQAGGVALQNNGIDASYSGQVGIGSPPQQFNIILDTGSSDLWVEDSECVACQGQKYNPGASTSYVATNGDFDISYGSGNASGRLARDTIVMGGQSVENQVFAMVDNMTPGLIASSVSGIMGLAFPALAYTKSNPWWNSVSGGWNEKLFTFYMKRYRNELGASKIEADGGIATFGYIDPSLHSGDITYVNVGADPQYWQVPMSGITVQGTNVPLGQATHVAVDTGTTLIGGPAEVVSAVYAAIPGSRPMTGSYENYYEYPCNLDIDLKLTFGDFTINIGNADFNLGNVGSDAAYCTGGVFVQKLSARSPVQWIVGATALKNTYTVFRYDPPAVGFAALPGAGGLSKAAAPAAANGTASVSANGASGAVGAPLAPSASSARVSGGASASGSNSGSGSAGSNADPSASPAPGGAGSAAAPLAVPSALALTLTLAVTLGLAAL